MKAAIQTRKAEAKRLLKKREGDIVEGRFQGLRVERIRFEEIAADFITDYKMNGKKSLERAERSKRRLEKTFKEYRAGDITTSRIKKYITDRQDKGARTPQSTGSSPPSKECILSQRSARRRRCFMSRTSKAQREQRKDRFF